MWLSTITTEAKSNRFIALASCFRSGTSDFYRGHIIQSKGCESDSKRVVFKIMQPCAKNENVGQSAIPTVVLRKMASGLTSLILSLLLIVNL